MRILHVVPTYVPAWRHGGPIYAVHGLARSLVARGHQVTVFTTNVNGPAWMDVPLGEPVDVDGVEVHYFPVQPPRRLYLSPALGRAVRGSVAGFDLVHLHSVFLWPTSAAARAAERADVPYVLSPRGMLVPELIAERGRLRKNAWMLLAERRTLERAAALHATSDLEAECAARLDLPLPPIHVIPNGLIPEPWDGETPEPVSRPFFLFLGRVSWKKGLDRLIPALAHCPGATLAIAGNDEEGLRPALERLAQESGVADRVVHLGAVDGQIKAALLHKAVALVLPSTSENFGNVVLESLSAGRPVVVTPGVGLAEMVRETGSGIVAEPENLGLAFRELLDDPAAAEAMGERGARAVAERFGWEGVGRQMEDLYERCLPSE